MYQTNTDLLRTERKQLGWTQAQVADALGISVKTVRRWEQGRCIPYPYYQRQLSILFGKSAQQLGLLEDPNEGIVRTEELMEGTLEGLLPLLQQASFVIDPTLWETLGTAPSLLGRSDLLMQVKERLFAADGENLVVLHGLPGSGKTALAAALAADQQAQAYFPDGILWAEMGRPPKVLSQLARWGTLLGIMPSQVTNIKSRQAWRQALQASLGSRRFLVIIDDAWSSEDAQAFLIGSPQCAYILTTRLPEVALAFGQGRVITVPSLENADGLALLAHAVPQLVDHDPQGALALVEAVEGLPLALTLLGSALALPPFSEYYWPLRAALAQLLETQKYLHRRMSGALNQLWYRLVETVPLSLCAVLAICEQRLSLQARATLCALTIFPPKPHGFSEEMALAVSRQPKEALNELWEAGFLESWRPGCYTLQQTVADYARARAWSWQDNCDIASLQGAVLMSNGQNEIVRSS